MKITDICIDGGTQTRAAIDTETVAEYTDLYTSGVRFPDIIVFHDGTKYWLADGFHRVAAAKRAGVDEINTEVRQGTRRDAVLYSVGANATHGLPRKNADKRRAVLTLLQDEEWSKWSNSEIARRAAVSESFVRKIRESHFAQNGVKNDRTYTTKHGTQATMNTENIGRKTPHTDPFHNTEDPPFANRAEKPQRKDDMWEEAIPYTREEEQEGEQPEAVEPDIAFNSLKFWIDSILEDVADVRAKHQVVNETLKYLRQLSIQFNQMSVR